MFELAYDLKAKLNNLTLAGQDTDGSLEFWGTDWNWRAYEDECKEYLQAL